jgi:hypothetical protein
MMQSELSHQTQRDSQLKFTNLTNGRLLVEPLGVALSCLGIQSSLAFCIASLTASILLSVPRLTFVPSVSLKESRYIDIKH